MKNKFLFLDLIKIIFLSISIIIYSQSIGFTLENKIILKIDNKIITKIDIYNEAKYLKVLNPKLKSLDEEKILDIAKTSLIREKIKEIEILKSKKIEIDKEYLESLIRNIYLNIGFEKKDEFVKYINSFDINLSLVKEKITQEALWNKLILQKFFSKIKIDKDKIKKDILLKKETSTEYLLSEIVYSTDQNTEAKELYDKIKETISKDGFENAAAIFSVSDSSKTGGKLGWINESSINKKILQEVSKIEVGNYTKPILIPGGFIILSIREKKIIEKKIDVNKELPLRIRLLQNQQLNQYSNMYFKRIKKNVLIDEK